MQLQWKTLAALAVVLLTVLPASAQQTVPDSLPGCQYNTTPPTLTSGQSALWQCDQNGKLITSGGGLGTVTSVSVATANGVSGTVANPTTTPAITLTLGAITPSSAAIGAGSAITSSGPGGALASGAYAAAGPCIAFGTTVGTCAQGNDSRFGSGTAISAVTPQLITATGTYTPTAGMKYTEVTCTAVGGTGGAGNGVTQNTGGGGGGAGATVFGVFSAATIGASQTVTIGAAGNNTTFGSLLTAVFGSKGAAGNATNGGAGGAGGTGGTTQSGSPDAKGGAGGSGGFGTTTVAFGQGGNGGPSWWGGGGVGGSGGGGGGAGTAYGSGGGGGSTGGAGGAGATGVCAFKDFS